MPITPHTEKHFTAGAMVRDAVIGMADGLTVPFALAAGLTGAIAQTGLSDPLQRFTREQMHDSFAHFRHNLDAHLRQLIRQLKRENNLAAAQTLARSHRLPAARQALTRALTAR